MLEAKAGRVVLLVDQLIIVTTQQHMNFIESLAQKAY